MGKNKTIPQGFMTVGEAAKKMDVTVRTLQYYDREGVLSPSAESEGGRRLYTDKDLVRLHQILSLKSLGFSLADIKKCLISLDDPADVAELLSRQAADIQREIDILSESLREVELLKEEVLHMQSVDFKKYADIIVNLQMKNESYGLIKHMDDQTLEHFRNHMDKESALAIIEEFNHLGDQIVLLQERGVQPDSETGQIFAEKFWKMIMQFTGGDMTMMLRLMEISGSEGMDHDEKRRLALINGFIEPALDIYLTQAGVNPFGEGQYESCHTNQ